MLNNILELEGVNVLNKKQQKIIKGGMQTCIIQLTNDEGNTSELSFTLSDGKKGSNEANSYCVNAVINDPTISGCGYDCQHDGFGQ